MLRERGSRRSVLKTGAALIAAGVTLGPRRTLAQATPEVAPQTLVIYSGQHEDLTNALAEAFGKDSGIPVEVRVGDDAELANQIIEEGDTAKAGVFISEDPGPAAMLDARGLLAPISPDALALVRPEFNPSSGNWLGYSGRARAIFYYPELITEDALPKSYYDLTKPEWKDTFAYAPSGAFVGVVTYLINTDGEEKTLEWLNGLKENGQNLQTNGAVRDAVEAGQIPFGLSNHYYWYVMAKEAGGPENVKSKVAFLGHKDPGAIVFAAGAGIPISSPTPVEAAKFVTWLANGPAGQTVLAANSPQYPLAPDVESSFGLKPLEELDPPVFDQGTLSDNAKAAQLLIDAGIV